MSGVKKILFATLFLLLREFLSVSFFINQTFAWSDQRIPSLLNSAAPLAATATKFDSARKTHSQFVLERTGEVTTGTEGFLTAKENVGVSRRSLVVIAPYCRNIFAPKVSRYISKSVFNI
jgi:hypothetical protein